jgi:hypothetical protein
MRCSPMDEQAIIAAVEKLNEQLATLDIWCSMEGLYPEFDYPDHSPSVYLYLLEEEMKQAETSGNAQLVTILMQCVIALRSAGVE